MGVLGLREFRLLFGAQAVSVLGDRMVAIALAFAVLELGGGATEVGIVMACRTLPLVATLLIGGGVLVTLGSVTIALIAALAALVGDLGDGAVLDRPRSGPAADEEAAGFCRVGLHRPPG
jgi:hypothetical protein